MRAFLLRVLGRPLAWVALAWLAAVLVGGLGAAHFAPFDPLEQDLLAAKQWPDAAHWLGTDEIGRDVASRLLHGAWPTLLGVAQALVVAGMLGLLMGLWAGYFGGRLDSVIAQVTNLLQSMPLIIIALAVLTVFNRSMLAAMVTFGILASAGTTRVVRSAALAVRHELYIEAARISGLSDAAIIVHHVLPRIVGPVIVQLALVAAIAVLVQTGVSFLGLGVPPPAPTWGSAILDASVALIDFPWLLVPSGGVVALTILAFGVLGDSLRDSAVAAWARPVQRRARARGGDDAAARAAREAALADAPAGALLSVRGLAIATTATGPLDAPRVLVQALSLDLMPGQTLGLVGESGSGKTLSILALMGLLPPGTRVTAGVLRLARTGEAPLTLDIADEAALAALRGRQLGMIFQEPMAALDPCFTIGHHLGEVIRRHAPGTSHKAARAQAIALLEQVRIPDAADVARRYPHQVSGGMAQRVGIARALAPRPRILLADEPTTALDVTVQAEILELLRTLKQETGMSVVFVTHDWGVVADICDRAMVLYRGQVLETQDILDIFERPRHAYTAALLRANPHHAPPGQRLPTVEDTLAAMGATAA